MTIPDTELSALRELAERAINAKAEDLRSALLQYRLRVTPAVALRLLSAHAALHARIAVDNTAIGYERRRAEAAEARIAERDEALESKSKETSELRHQLDVAGDRAAEAEITMSNMGIEVAELRAAKEELVAFHDAWVDDQVARATGDPDLARAKREALVAAHQKIRAKHTPETAPQGSGER